MNTKNQEHKVINMEKIDYLIKYFEVQPEDATLVQICAFIIILRLVWVSKFFNNK